MTLLEAALYVFAALLLLSGSVGVFAFNLDVDKWFREIQSEEDRQGASQSTPTLRRANRTADQV